MKGVGFALVLCVLGVLSYVSPTQAAVRTNISFTALNLNPGLVGWWTFDGKDMVQNVRDSSGSGNTGYLSGFTSTTTGQGVVGQALKLDGSDDRVTIPDNASLDLRANDTVSVFAWVKRSSEQANAGVVWDNRSYFLQTASGKFRLGHFKSDNVSYYRVDVNAPLASDGRWHFIGQTFDGSVTTLYVDGVVVTDVSVLNGPDGGGLGYGDADHNGYIGQAPTFANSALGGQVDDVRVYNRVLSAAEIKQFYKFGVSGSNFRSAPISNLVGHWTFDAGDMKLNARDVSGRGNNGFLLGFTSTTTVVGKLAQALSFNGSSDYISVTTAPSLETLTAFTVSTWAKASDVSANHIMVRKTDADVSDLFQLDIFGSKVRCLANAAGAGVVSAGGDTTIAANVWYHLVSTYDGSTVRCYINAVQESTTAALTGTVNTTGNNLYMGRSEIGQPHYYAGTLDDVRIYNRAFTAAEVAQLYRAGKEIYINRSITPLNLKNGLVGHWTFDGRDMHPNVRDVSGSSNHGRLVSMTPTTTVQGILGQALKFDGVDDRLDIKDSVGGNNTSDISTQNFSVSLWARIGEPVEQFIAKKSETQTDGANNYELVFYGSAAGCGGEYPYRFYFGVWSGGVPYYRFSDLTYSGIKLNQWYHVVGTYSSGDMNLYVNGELRNGILHRDACASSAAPATRNLDSTYTTTMAGGNGGGATVYPDTIDDVRIYNRVLSATEIKQLYKLGL